MTTEEYRHECGALHKRHKSEQFEIDKRYASAHNDVKIGDIIKDHYHTIRVDKMVVTKTYSTSMPCCRYEGVRITKAGAPFASGECGAVFQPNLEEINGEQISE